jgi:hypothetical protein
MLISATQVILIFTFSLVAINHLLSQGVVLTVWLMRWLLGRSIPMVGRPSII